jgi:hypothetical protein
MAVLNVQKLSVARSPYTFFSFQKLKTEALLEEKGQQTDQSSSEGQGPSPYKQMTLRYEPESSNAISRLYRYYKENGGPEALTAFLEKHPSIAESMLKQLLKDPSLSSSKKAEWLSTLSKKIDFSHVVKQEKVLEDIQKIIPQVFQKNFSNHANG